MWVSVVGCKHPMWVICPNVSSRPPWWVGGTRAVKVLLLQPDRAVRVRGIVGPELAFMPGMSLLITTVLALNLATPAAGVQERHAARWSHMYHLADVNGTLPTSWAAITYDSAAGELFAIDTAQRSVRVFGSKGMQTFRFGDDDALGTASALAPMANGDLIVIAMNKGKHEILRCNFRGKKIHAIKLSDIPAPVAKDFRADRVVVRYNKLYFADTSRMRVVVTTAKGQHLRSYDLAIMLNLDARKREETGITGFNVDHAENLLFTIQPLFMGFVVSPEGKLKGFGSKGSRPGKFNIIGGIASDEAGNTYVTDMLRGVVLVFDQHLRFRGEFGSEIEGFRSPRYVAAGNGKVFVSLGARRGIATFRVSVSPLDKPKKQLAVNGVLRKL